MSQKQTQSATRTRRTARRTGVALMVSLGFVASACANVPNPCGVPPVESANRQTGVFRDPYTQRKQFERSVAAYRATAARDNDGANMSNTQWRVCIDAQGLAPYTREVASDIRPRFNRALARVVARTRTPRQAPGAYPDDAVAQAIDEFLAAMPRFWRSPAASLRGARQPGSSLHTHY